MASKEIVPYLNVPLSSALFTVDTRDGVRSDPATGYQIVAQNPYDINIYKNQQLFSGAVERIALTEVNLPWNIPNVNDYNNVLFLRYTGPSPGFPDKEIVVPVGFYTPSALATAIQNLLNAGAGSFGFTTWTCSWSADTNHFTLTMIPPSSPPAPSLRGFAILPKLGQAKGSSGGYLRSSTLAEMMGFNSASSTYATQVVSSWATMLYTTYVDIVSSILCKHQDVRDTSTSYFTGNNILARIYISPDRYYSVSDTTIIGVKPFQLHYEFPVPKEIKWEPTEFLASCNIRLQDDKGNALYFLPTAPTVPGLVGSTLICGNTAFVQMSMLISEATY